MPISKRNKMLVVTVLGSVCVLFTVLVIRGEVSMQIEEVPVPALKDISPPVWTKLSQQRIYFGHQSVGKNIIAGLHDILGEHPEINLNIVETSDPKQLSRPAFAHSRVGTNRDPKSKLDAFADLMAKGMADNVDVAFFKLCYVDVTETTAIEEIFAEYKNTMSRLKREYPKTVFAHVTVPLTSRQTGPKAWIKTIIGRSVYGCEENIKRYHFNSMLKSEYEGKEPIFDLASMEATSPDGKRYLCERYGLHFQAVIPEYTDDGGHMNTVGRRELARQLLVFLTSLVK